MDILLVEDSLADAYLTRKALKAAFPEGRVRLVQDGEQALVYLQSGSAVAAHPDLIILDLNLPRIDGFTLLAQLKTIPQFRNIPVVILTTSTLESDIMRASALGAYSYLSKPMDLDAYLTLGGTIAELWHQWALQPETLHEKSSAYDALSSSDKH